MFTLPTFLENKEKALYLNPAWDSVKCGVLIPKAQGINIPAASSIANLGYSDDQILEAPTDAYAEIYGLIGTLVSGGGNVNRVLCQFRDTGIVERFLMNHPVLFNHVFGTALNPMYLRSEDASQPIWMDPLQVLFIKLMNSDTTGAVTANFAALQSKYQRMAMKKPNIAKNVQDSVKRYRCITPYWFTMDSVLPGTTISGVQIAAGATQDIFFTAPSDVELCLTSAMATAITVGIAGDTLEVFNAQFFDAQTDRPYQSQPVTLHTGFGTPSFPSYFDVPVIVPPTYKLRARFTNLITDAPIDLFVTFHGVANYKYAEHYMQ